MTDEECVQVYGMRENNGVFYFDKPYPGIEVILQYLLDGVVPGKFIKLDKRYRHDTPPLEKVYPFLQSLLSEKEINQLNQEYFSLIKQTQKEYCQSPPK
jgi:hypothetical protein